MKNFCLTVLLFLCSLLCFASCMRHGMKATNVTTSYQDEKEENDQMNETTPSINEKLQGLPIMLSDGLATLPVVSEQKKYSIIDFLPLKIGISTLNDLNTIVGNEYPAIATSYGAYYHFDLQEGGELQIKVNNNGVIFEINQK